MFLNVASVLWWTVYTVFSKPLMKCLQIPLRKPNIKLDLKSQQTIFSLITLESSLNKQINKFAYRSNPETKNLAFFLSKYLATR